MNYSPPTTIFTIGHSDRTLDEFLALLKEREIGAVLDVRRFPTSKFDHFRKKNLQRSLMEAGIRYLHVPNLGGYRGGYTEYTDTSEFETGLNDLLDIASRHTTAIMCAEQLFFRCHRRFIADKLLERGIRILHIMNGRLQEHKEPSHQSTLSF